MSQKKAPPHVTAAILEVVENQIKDGKPPETKLTVKRLCDSGLERKEAIRLVACVVTNEMFHIMKYSETFNEKRFIENLKLLPSMPWM